MTSSKANELFKINIRRMATFLSVRVFPLPISVSSMSAKGYNMVDLLEDAMNGFTVSIFFLPLT